MLHCLAGQDEPALPLHVATPGSLEALSRRLPPGAASFLSATGFAAKAQEVALLPGEGGLAGAVLGLGDAAPDPWSFGALPDKLPAGSVWRMSPIFLRTWYQTLGTSLGGELSASCRMVSDSPGLV